MAVDPAVGGQVAVKQSLPPKIPTALTLGLESSLTCPHCWEISSPQELLWIAEHQELLGDTVLGPEVSVRFKPSRFTVDCKAIDARGMACTRLACPRCHLQIPRQLVDCSPMFISIIGVPASGKSYFLTSLTWMLRSQLPSRFGISFSDADPAGNQSLLDYEQTLFMAEDATRVVALRKTELQGELYANVKLGEHAMMLPKPFTFFLKPTEAHPNANLPNAGKQLHKVLCLYDNAGEHFQPGMDTSSSPVTQHLGKAFLLMFLFDPTQDPRFREKLGNLPADSARSGRTQRQETVIHEAAARVRRQVGLVDGTRHKRPLIVVLPKLDVWEALLAEPVGDEPFAKNLVNGRIDAVDQDRVEHVSKVVRDLLVEVCPEVIAAAETFCEQVIYVPVSAVGVPPVQDAETGMLGFRPADIRPRWVTVPMLYGLSKYAKGLIAASRPTAVRSEGRPASPISKAAVIAKQANE
jgi:hypothetical protein